ncbi:hypothetical protein S83_037670 [Arachis hypogaea]
MFWMAHGLLQPTREDEDAEDIGELYINKLVSASLLQIDASSYSFNLKNSMTFKRLKMHDLVHELAKLTMKESSKARSIVQLGKQEEASMEELASDKFKYLKVFNLEEMKFTSLPDNCFAKMKKHLRYLNLKGCSSLKTLPNSICDLQNLQCLNLPKCYNLQELPTNMKNLISLQYFFLTVKVTSLSSMNIGHFRQLKFLFLWYCTKLVYVPSAVGRLTALKKLVIHWCTELVNFEGEEEEKKKNVAAYSLNLQVLVINGSFKLEALSDWLYRATKLRYLRIWGGRMESFPTCFPSNSLEELQYISCRLLSFLPNNLDQFHNLQFLEIEDCPILSARYNRKTGLNLKKIAHIPHCEIDMQDQNDDDDEEDGGDAIKIKYEEKKGK